MYSKNSVVTIGLIRQPGDYSRVSILTQTVGEEYNTGEVSIMHNKSSHL